jgi:D-tyrosyl-tRNA(Tyr) deacylase
VVVEDMKQRRDNALDLQAPTDAIIVIARHKSELQWPVRTLQAMGSA